jgi:tetratricopeptide (TPR) repeat protein
LLHLEILLAEGMIDEALLLSDSLQVPRGMNKIYPAMFFYNIPFKSDIIPRIYIAKNEIHNAIKAYERITSIRPGDDNDRRFIPPWYHYNLAKLYEQVGRKDDAIKRYRHLLNIWKDADKDIFERIDAQNRLEILESNH